MKNRCWNCQAAPALASASAHPFLTWLGGPFSLLFLLFKLTLFSSY